MDVKFSVSLTSSLGGGNKSRLPSGRSVPGKEPSVIVHQESGWALDQNWLRRADPKLRHWYGSHGDSSLRAESRRVWSYRNVTRGHWLCSAVEQCALWTTRDIIKQPLIQIKEFWKSMWLVFTVWDTLGHAGTRWQLHRLDALRDSYCNLLSILIGCSTLQSTNKRKVSDKLFYLFFFSA